jgi:hypothetical protein
MSQILLNRLKNTFKVLFIIIGFTSAYSFAGSYNTEEATRFSKIFAGNALPTASQLKDRYLSLGDEGLNIFQSRIKSEEYLAKAIKTNPRHYEKAIAICLPVADEITSEAELIINSVGSYLNMTTDLTISIIFGANNTGGTANANGIAIALEVICQQVESAEQAKKVLLSYIAHEIVHVYQYRVSKRKSLNFTLLELSLIEGVADLIANEVLHGNYVLETDRVKYGKAHEASLWDEFQLTMFEMNYAPWMYSASLEGRPIDLGYWVGKRIASSFKVQHQSKKAALRELLILEDASQILKESGYSPE